MVRAIPYQLSGHLVLARTRTAGWMDGWMDGRVLCGIMNAWNVPQESTLEVKISIFPSILPQGDHPGRYMYGKANRDGMCHMTLVVFKDLLVALRSLLLFNTEHRGRSSG